MDPTSLPTDNLYKFMALSGLAIVGFCIWFSWKRGQAGATRVNELRLKEAMLIDRTRWDLPHMRDLAREQAETRQELHRLRAENDNQNLTHAQLTDLGIRTRHAQQEHERQSAIVRDGKAIAKELERSVMS